MISHRSYFISRIAELTRAKLRRNTRLNTERSRVMKLRTKSAGNKSLRKTNLSAWFLGALVVALVLALNGLPRVAARPKPSPKKPVKLLGGILLPGNPLRFHISWVDQATGRYYLAEAGNAAVDVIDGENRSEE